MSAPRLGPRDWARLTDVFHGAVHLDPAERAAFVSRACADAPALEAEVLSLLAAHDRADAFLATPVAASGDRLPVVDANGRVGDQIGHYRIERLLGQGGMGVVYLARDERLGRHVALKAVAPLVTRDPASRDRLRREARAAAALAHPGIATVYALEEFGDDLFIAAEFVDGWTLRHDIARGPARAPVVLDTAMALARALAAAHDHGIVHRDLKPDNVMRARTGGLKILDFGLAHTGPMPAAPVAGGSQAFGTPGYMSPEQIRRGPVDARADLFSLGILLHELLTAQHPFAGPDAAATIAGILEGDPSIALNGAPSGTAEAALWQGLIAVIRALLRTDPEARPPSAHALLKELDALKQHWEASQTDDGASRGAARRWWRLHQGATCAAYALLLVPVGLAGDWLTDHRAGVLLFLAALAPAVAAITLRLHLWFAASALPAEWAAQYARSRRWLRLADLSYVVVLEAAGLAVFGEHQVLAAVLVGAGVLAWLSAAIIEPATTRAAFPQASVSPAAPSRSARD